MAFLQAYIDDSVSSKGDQRLFMAGYVNTAPKWALFSEAWEEELRSRPRIKYLKMSEANNLSGQFRGWEAEPRDEKLRGLVRVIRHFEPMSFEFSVSREQYFRILRPVAPRGLGNPHFTCAFGAVSTLARQADNEGLKIPIDFIFDKQEGVEADVQIFFDYMKKNLPKGARKLISKTPAFVDDKLYLPLQAADMLAWHIRREHEDYGCMGGLSMATALRNADGHLHSEIGEDELASWASSFSAMPAIKGMQSKGQWRAIRREAARQSSLGFIPPHGSMWKNAIHRVRERLARFIKP